MHKAFGDKLIEVTKRHAGEIAKQWSKAVRKNPRTPSYHSADMERCVVNALEFYINIGLLYFSEEHTKKFMNSLGNMLQSNLMKTYPWKRPYMHSS